MIVSEKKAKMTSSREVAHFFREHILTKLDPFDKDKEHFWLMTLNGRHVSQKVRVISVGCLTSSIVHPRECFRPAVCDGAASVLFVHNHPSGDPSPSEEDMRLTERLKECGTLLGIKVLDHVIVAENGFKSLME